MEDQTRREIIIAAVGAAGPVGNDVPAWNAEVAYLAASITAMIGQKSLVTKVVSAVESASPWSGTILSIEKEEKSTRAKIMIKTNVSDNYPDGIEPARTEQTFKPEGLAMAKRLQKLIGHRVTFWIDLQQIPGTNKKMRVICHVEDQGLAREDAAA